MKRISILTFEPWEMNCVCLSGVIVKQDENVDPVDIVVKLDDGFHFCGQVFNYVLMSVRKHSGEKFVDIFDNEAITWMAIGLSDEVALSANPFLASDRWRGGGLWFWAKIHTCRDITPNSKYVDKGKV